MPKKITTPSPGDTPHQTPPALPEHIAIPQHLAADVDRLAQEVDLARAEFEHASSQLAQTLAYYNSLTPSDLQTHYSHNPARSLLERKPTAPPEMPETYEIPQFLNEPILQLAQRGQEVKRQMHQSITLMQQTLAHYNGITVEQLLRDYRFGGLAEGYHLNRNQVPQ